MQHISVNELKHKIKEYILLDIREEFEREDDGYIPHSVNIPGFEIPHRILDFLLEHEGKFIVVYCHSGKRSKALIETLLESHLYPEHLLFNLTGGFEEWVRQGHETALDS